LQSLSARFGIEQSNYIRGNDIVDYKPSERIFRAFKIKGQNKILLEDQWIQKSGTKQERTIKGARLASRSEKLELLKYRKRKGKGYQWL